MFSGIITYDARFWRDNMSIPHPPLWKRFYTTPQDFQSSQCTSDSETKMASKYFLETRAVPLVQTWKGAW